MAFTALAAGVSGLQAFTEGVGVIADNITNVNTIGYKETRSRFSTLVTETSSANSYSPGGVRAFAETLVSKQGLLQPSSSATDLAVDGAGFFAVRSSDSANATDGELVYTRSGAFTEDDEGFYRNTAGLYLMGWRLDAQGNPPTNLQSSSALQPINITQLNGISEATTNVAMKVNLAAGESIETATYAPGNLATEHQATGSGVTPDLLTNIQVFDSLGREHTVMVSAVKTGANTWSYEYHFDDPDVLDRGDHGTNGLIGYGELAFNSDGSVNLGASTLFSPTATATDLLTANGSSALTFSYAPTTQTPAPVATVSAGSIVIDFGTNGNTDGWALSGEATSDHFSSSVDGAAFGSVKGVQIDEDGFVSATFANGLSKRVYQIPIAVFDNPNGLTRKQGNAFGVSSQSGDVSLQRAGESGAGKVAPNSLEGSTVDLASEFAELIKVQRAFSASTRIITTSDEILQELTRI